MADTLDELNEKLRSGNYHLIKEDYALHDDVEEYVFHIQREDLESRLLRLQAEKMRLQNEANRLHAFLKTSDCNMLSQEEQYLLGHQWNVMNDYLNTLKKRIKLIKEKL